MLYAYHSNDISTIAISQTNISQYIIKEFITPMIFDKTDQLSLKIESENVISIL